jgi:hypothetical protein
MMQRSTSQSSASRPGNLLYFLKLLRYARPRRTVRAEHAMHIAPRVALSIDGFLVGGFMLACSPAAMGPVTVFADPGKYEYYSCEQIAAQRTYWTGRELEMKLLMDKADQGTGGTVVNVIAYQGDYVVAREELKVIDATARAKNCDAPRRP